jgi:hypothetical protein
MSTDTATSTKVLQGEDRLPAVESGETGGYDWSEKGEYEYDRERDSAKGVGGCWPWTCTEEELRSVATKRMGIPFLILDLFVHPRSSHRDCLSRRTHLHPETTAGQSRCCWLLDAFARELDGKCTPFQGFKKTIGTSLDGKALLIVWPVHEPRKEPRRLRPEAGLPLRR